jgi:hypothetical protein
MMQLKLIERGILILFLFLLFSFCPVHSFAQGYPEEGDYLTVFEEPDLYIGSYKKPRSIFEETQQSVNGYLGVSNFFRTPQQEQPRSTNGVPDPPPPPDAPINSELILLMLAGSGLGIYKLRRSISCGG